MSEISTLPLAHRRVFTGAYVSIGAFVLTVEDPIIGFRILIARYSWLEFTVKSVDNFH